jgi:CheY-like chemotaxis protein
MEVDMAGAFPVEQRHRIRVRVRDTGIGIPENRIGHLFQSFTQVDAETNRAYGGTGLGLAISRRLVEMMGGNIHVESRMGQGATFEFTFTAGIADQALGAVETVHADSPKGLKILVAEDNKINQIVTVRMLERMGCVADLACDGASAIRSVQTHAYDLVLMDLGMPDLDGFEATRQIRRLPGAQSCVPIVALTASASNQVRSQCLAAGMNDYLCKPMEREALSRALDRWGHCSSP